MAKIPNPPTNRPTEFDGLAEALSKGVFVKSKIVRRIIDKNKEIVQIIKLNEDYENEFNKFKKDIEEAIKREGPNSKKTVQVGEGRFQIATARRMLDTINAGNEGVESAGVTQNLANFRQINRFFRKAFPALVKNHELGHQNIGIVKGLVATGLSAIPLNDPRRKKMLALYAILQEIDKVNPEGANMIDVVDKVKKIASRGRNFKTDWEKDVSIIKGASGRVELEYEDMDFNQEKGYLASIIGTYFKELIEQESKNVDAFLAGIEYENFRGSTAIVDDILDLAADTIDPKKKFKTRRTRRTKKNKTRGSTSSKIRKAKLTAPVIPGSPRSNTNQRRDLSPLALVTLINNKLPDVVAKQMVPPRLQLRTGRLAQSARVIDVQATSQGFPSIGYTYDKDPYQVFEASSGTRFSDRERDPRTLIDASIREIAATLFTGRLFTRRI